MPCEFVLLCPHLFLMSFVSPKRLCSNRLTRTLHVSLLQGHILPPRGLRHPRPAPLVLQVLESSLIVLLIRVGALASLVYPHLFLMSYLVDFYLDFIPLFVSSCVALSIPLSLPLLSPTTLPHPVSLSFFLSFRPHLGLDLVFFFGLYPCLLSQAKTSMNTLFCYPSVRLSFVLL